MNSIHGKVTVAHGHCSTVRIIPMFLVAALFIFTTIAQANPASDRAFGNCLATAAAFFSVQRAATQASQIGTVTLVARNVQGHLLRITPAELGVEPAAIFCNTSGGTTAIEVITPGSSCRSCPALP